MPGTKHHGGHGPEGIERSVGSDRIAPSARAAQTSPSVHEENLPPAQWNAAVPQITPETDLTTLSDKDLVVAFKSGQIAAYDEIYRRHQARVRAICRRMLNDMPDAEEATQEAFLRSYQALHRFNGRYQLGAWLSRIATNICVDQLRHRKRTPDTEPHEEILCEEPTPNRPDQMVTEQMHLNETLGSMQPLHAEALLLRAVHGLSHEEMAGRLEMTPQQVKSLLHRARNSFRRAWQEASGFFVAPLLGMKAMFGRKHTNTVNDLAGTGGPATAITMERIAAAGMAVALAIAGMGSSSDKPAMQHPTWPAESMPLPPQAEEIPTKAHVAAAPTNHSSTTSTQEAPAEDELLPLTALVFEKVPTEDEPGPDDDDRLPLSPTAANERVSKMIKEAEDRIDDLGDPSLSDR